MASGAFSAADFQVFALEGFKPRMEAIRSRVRPRLEALGRGLSPDVARATSAEAFAHVAKHARRTVNPPDDTWVAFAPDRRGYKKHCHFKVAVSRNCVRFLFEVGPEHADKARWRAAWKKNAAQLGAVLRRVQGLGWIKNELDDEPAGMLSDLDAEGLTQLAEDRLRGRDGQLVIGRAVPAAEAARWREADYRARALETFRPLAPLYRLK